MRNAIIVMIVIVLSIPLAYSVPEIRYYGNADSARFEKILSVVPMSILDTAAYIFFVGDIHDVPFIQSDFPNIYDGYVFYRECINPTIIVKDNQDSLYILLHEYGHIDGYCNHGDRSEIYADNFMTAKKAELAIYSWMYL